MIKINNVNLAVKQIEIDKTNPTLIFLHDSLGCIELWRDFPDKLVESTKFNALIYDRQGYGNSDSFTSSERKIDYLEKEAEVLNRIIEYYKLNEVILFGFSDGGTIALLTAAKFPNKINAVITEGAHVFVEEMTRNGVKEAIKNYETTNLKQKLEKYHGAKTDDLFWAWTRTWSSDWFKNWNIEHYLPQIVCPTLVIQGEKDEYGSLGQVNAIINQISGKGDRMVVENVGHCPHKEQPELVLERCSEFILKNIFPLK